MIHPLDFGENGIPELFNIFQETNNTWNVGTHGWLENTARPGSQTIRSSKVSTSKLKSVMPKVLSITSWLNSPVTTNLAHQHIATILGRLPETVGKGNRKKKKNKKQQNQKQNTTRQSFPPLPHPTSQSTPTWTQHPPSAARRDCPTHRPGPLAGGRTPAPGIGPGQAGPKMSARRATKGPKGLDASLLGPFCYLRGLRASGFCFPSRTFLATVLGGLAKFIQHGVLMFFPCRTFLAT